MKRTGFTLIELVVVMVVIGILAAIAIPKFVDLTGQAKKASEEGTVGGVRAGIMLQYANANPHVFPATLDAVAAATNCSATALCFETVVSEPVTQGGADGWKKCDATTYRGPSTNCYQYSTVNGRFAPIACPAC
ncbi:MAG: type II secretion system protein [Candidatus Omnitrophica bacterium]|nr:type II secretion system protein [Candidatus Omnitrophota bacterium]MBI3083469.1 type II secretion system protein [Candidatus Omnitrophota bacterium]